MNTLRTVLKKELTDAIRDRRAWMVVLMTTLISGPATMLLLSRFMTDLKARAEQRELLVDGAQHAFELERFFQRHGRSVVRPPADVRERIEAGQFDDAVLVVPPGFSEALKHGNPIELTVLHDANRPKSVTAAATLERLVAGWSQELGMQRLLVRGIDPTLLKPARTTMVSMGGGRGGAARLLFLIPLVALLAGVIGALSIAIDVTAGERERGSLEPLLMNPIPLWSLVLGKWLAVCSASVATLIGSVVSFALAAQLITDETLAAAFQFGVAEASMCLVVLAPFCLFISAMLMLSSLFAHSHKEAQAYTSYLVSFVSIVPSFSMFLSLQDARWQLLVPALGQNMVLARVFRGSAVSTLDLATPAVLCLAWAALALWAQTRLLRREAIVFARG